MLQENIKQKKQEQESQGIFIQKKNHNGHKDLLLEFNLTP
jgi:hypothetical protein